MHLFVDTNGTQLSSHQRVYVYANLHLKFGPYFPLLLLVITEVLSVDISVSFSGLLVIRLVLSAFN